MIVVCRLLPSITSAALSILLWAAALSPQLAWSYPEMVRHGYVNCMTCHASPSGGGIPTQYGRELSREVLSAAGKEGESDFAYGKIKTPEWLSLGGNLRAAGIFKDSPTETEGHVIPMQADIEAAIAYKKMLLVGTGGLSGGRKQSVQTRRFKDNFISRRHYVAYRPTDEISLRTGKFQPAFGINIPEHAVFIKRGLGWDQGTETYNTEAAWIGERTNFFATGILGRPDARELKREKGGALLASYAPGETYKTGVSYFYGVNELQKRHVAGPFGILGFTPHFFLLTEFDFQGAKALEGASRDTKWGFVNYQRLDYEFVQGFHGYLTQEFSRLDFGNSQSIAKTYGIGIQYFPRPHFELNFSWQIQTIATSSEYTDLGFLMFHFYP